MSGIGHPLSAQHGWVGVDFDGTLAYYDGWKGDAVLGAPIPAMVERVKQWLASGIEVRIVTARFHNGMKATIAIDDWCRKHIGHSLPITATKDMGMIELWDDRAIQVEKNTGRRIDGL